MAVPVRPGDLVRPLVPVRPEDLVGPGTSAADPGDSPETAIDQYPPDPDFPSRVLLRIGTAGPDQIVRELARDKGKWEAVNLGGEIKVRSKQDQKWYNFDPSGWWRGMAEFGRDIGDVVPEGISMGAQVAGTAAGFLGTGGPAAPMVSIPAGIASGAAAAGGADFLRTQGLGRLLGYQPDLKESGASALKEATFGAISGAAGPAVRPLMRVAGPALRALPAIDAAAGRFLARAGRANFPHLNRLSRFIGPSAGVSWFTGGFGSAVGTQLTLGAMDIAGALFNTLSSQQGLILLQNLATRAPAMFGRPLQALINAKLQGTLHGGDVVVNALLRVPGMAEWLKQQAGGLLGEMGPGAAPERAGATTGP